MWSVGFSEDLFAAATRSPNIAVVPKWERFEAAFTSLADYANPLQDVTLTVEFVSPLGESSRVYGFWDGGRIWRVRFAPNQAGHWKFKTTCSDGANLGLNDQTGEFLCSASLSPSRFYRHGLVRVASDHKHLEHADGTPFFWLADTAWDGARLSDMKSWEVYGLVRSSQNFTVSQWSASPGADAQGHSALTGFPERIGVDPEFFKALDKKVVLLGEVGMLSAIAPLLELQPTPKAVALPDDQAILLVRYAVARWGADPVVWFLPVPKGTRSAESWKKIGHEVFSGIQHAPVLIYAADSPEVLTAFNDQDWAEVVGFQVPRHNALEMLRSIRQDTTSNQAQHSQGRPLIGFTPQENGLSAESGKRWSAEDVRHAGYWAALAAQAAGVSYSGHGVADWDTTVDSKEADKLGAGLPLWHKALFMPGAKQMGHLAGLLDNMSFWQLKPDPKLLAGQETSTKTQVFASATATKDLALVYVAQERMLEVAQDEMPRPPKVTWFNPRTGQDSAAVAVVVQNTCQFPTPDPGDWLLMIQAGK